LTKNCTGYSILQFDILTIIYWIIFVFFPGLKKEKVKKMLRNKKNKISSAFVITLLLASLAVLLVSCASEAPVLPDTYNVQKGSIIQTVTSSGSVDSSDKKNYSLSVAGEVTKSLKKGEYFKKGDILIEVSNDRTQILARQAEESLKTAETSIEIAKLNYQTARNANHVAIQLSQSSAATAEQATLNAFKTMEDANILAESSINSANKSIANANLAADASIISAQIALNIANNNYNEVISDVTSTPSEINTAKDQLRTAQATYDQAVIKAESGVLASQAEYNQAQESARSQTDTAAGAYEQALNNQSTNYWSNLNSVQAAQAQMQLTQKNIEQAENQLALSRINLELVMLDIDKNKLTAPYDGIVLESNFSNGVYAGPGPAISVISSIFEVKSDINETDISKIKVGQDVDITLDAFPEHNFTGKVSSIAPIAKNIAGIITFEVKVTPDDNKNPGFMYGISANLEIATLKIEDVLLVPAEAIYEENGKKYVDAVDGAAEADNAIKKIEVTTGASDYNNTEILTGLKEGDVIYSSQVVLPDSTNQGGIRGMFGGMGG
jgi:HlyD family secretion protein